MNLSWVGGLEWRVVDLCIAACGSSIELELDCEASSLGGMLNEIHIKHMEFAA